MAAPFLTNIFTRAVERFEVRVGLVGEDAHKEEGRYLPKSGGLGFLLGWTASLILYMAGAKIEGTPISMRYLVVGTVLVWIAGLIGLYDDVKRLGGKEKVLLTAVPGIIVAALGLYAPWVYIPVIGNVRMTIVYPLLLPVIFAVASNAINMADTFTGIAPGITMILLSSMMATIFLLEGRGLSWDGGFDSSIVLITIALLSLIGYIPRNFHPGKTFNGDTGSLSWGALLALVAIWGKVEIFLALSAMPIVANGFTILSSIKGIIEHHNLKERPTVPNRERNTIRANLNKEAPITLVHILTITDELCEKEIVIVVYILVAMTSFASLLIAAFL
ncbi:MAG: hypothetical protein QXK13_01135 [Fervidicoccaceae archaeon]